MSFKRNFVVRYNSLSEKKSVFTTTTHYRFVFSALNVYEYNLIAGMLVSSFLNEHTKFCV